ncbi:MAG: ribonuclease domain-containing protein [Bacilli bacterium]|nr:hypothetical protein [Bacilli bacterium]
MKKILKLLSLIALLFIGLFGCEFIESPTIPNITPPVIEDSDKLDENIDDPEELEDEEEQREEENPIEENPIEEAPVKEEPVEEDIIDYDGLFTSRDDVALYIYVYGHLPSNYRTKSEVSRHISYYYTHENKLSIGGDIFYNREGLLPKKSGRTYYEADINYRGQSSRNSERIVFSNDGLIFYTDDHYESFIEYDGEINSWK